MAQQQKAALLVAKQGKVEVGTHRIPSPQGKQALVKVTAAAHALFPLSLCLTSTQN
jgi:D-arabinose 1-dehydrogenase-like Zn-dependent alcohol dehydrogenase